MGLSRNASVEAILAEIPFFAVGLLAFGTFTFFLVMKALNRWVFALHASVFLAFVGAIFDLSDVLSHGSPFRKKVQPFNLGGLQTTREILYALSVGMLFTFLWGLVAEPPPGERERDENNMHAGSWDKWGVVGMSLKWSLAACIVAITVLQLLYRLVSFLHQFGPVYEVECTIRIVVSAVLVLKILLNTYLAVLSSSRDGIPRWIILRDYSPVVAAILLGMALAIGDIIQFMFSATVLGTFLQAIEFYILIVYVLITAFYYARNSPPATGKRNINRSSSFRGLPPISQRESFFRISPVQVPVISVSEPDFLSMGPSDKTQQLKDQSRRPSFINTSGGSVASRMSAWLAPRALTSRIPSFSSASPSPSPDVDRLWDQDDAERGISPTQIGTGTAVEFEVKGSRGSFDSPMEPKESAKWQDPMFTRVLRESNSNGNLSSATYTQSFSNVAPLAIPQRVFSRPMTPISGTDSPIYGLTGIVQPRPPPTAYADINDSRPVSQADGDGNMSRTTSISYLFREQAELDKTIASLKLLSRPEEDDAKPSSAVQSEFSLSNFPAPPWGRGSVAESVAGAMTPTPPLVTVEQADPVLGTGIIQDEMEELSDSELSPPRMPAAAAEHGRTLSVPYSDDGDSLAGGRRARMDSEGTQYEITSFIGAVSLGSVPSDNASDNPSRNPPLSTSPQNSATLLAVPSRTGTPASSLPRLKIPSAGGQATTISGLSISRPIIGLPPRPRLGTRGNLSPLVERLSPKDEFERPRPAPSPATSSRAASP
ncbi:unnamed protein product [Somion occarium]|uniref:Uncharacterized protein n=1 Tax=Somion occarium TaxID=3059160 RepID=A0ABP1CN06_9APHY